MKILMVLTSHDRLGDTGTKTGFWLEEFAAPYYFFRDADAELTLASPKGGQPPVDPRSLLPPAQTSATHRFQHDKHAQAALAHTKVLAGISAGDYDAAFYPGGHGPLWDLANDPHSIALIETIYLTGRPVALVCHGPGALRYTRATDGRPLVTGKSVTGFSNTEEEAIGLTHAVPFLVEDMLRNNGGKYSKKPNWHPYAVTDGDLITGQNPGSSESTARELLARDDDARFAAPFRSAAGRPASRGGSRLAAR
jgi:putative intracellular protease/amidase